MRLAERDVEFLVGSRIAAETITASEIRDATITAAQIASATITTTQIAAATIATADIANDAVTAALVADDAIATASIIDDAVTAAKVADDAIATASIVDNAITAALVADDAIATASIVDNAVTAAKVADDAIATASIIDNAVTAAKVADDAIATASIIDNAVTAAKLALTSLSVVEGGTAPSTVFTARLTSSGEAKLGLYRSDASISSGDEIGGLYFGGSDGGENQAAASLKVTAAANWSSDAQGTQIEFWTATTGSTAAAKNVVINHSGFVGINEAAPGAYIEAVNTAAASTMTALFVNVAHDPAVASRAVAIQDRGTDPGGDGNIILDLDFSADRTVSGATFIRCQDKDGEIGSCKADGGASVAWNTSSDYRLKENLRPVSNATARLNALRPQDGNYLLQPDVDRTFLVAHEIQEAGVGLGYLVFGAKDAVLAAGDIPDGDTSRQVGGAKHQQVNLPALTPLLVAGIQELAARVARLEAA